MLRFHGIVNPEDAVEKAQREAMDLLIEKYSMDWNFLINTFHYDATVVSLLGDAAEIKKLEKIQRNLCFVALEAEEYLYKPHSEQTKAVILANIEQHYRDSVFLHKKQQRISASKSLENNPVFQAALSIFNEYKVAGNKISYKILSRELNEQGHEIELKTLSNWLTKIKKST